MLVTALTLLSLCVGMATAHPCHPGVIAASVLVPSFLLLALFFGILIFFVKTNRLVVTKGKTALTGDHAGDAKLVSSKQPVSPKQEKAHINLGFNASEDVETGIGAAKTIGQNGSGPKRSDDVVSAPVKQSVTLTGRENIGLGFTVTKSRTDDIIVASIKKSGPAVESNLISQGDVITSLKIYFDQMNLEDALHFFSYADKYRVTVDLVKKTMDTETLVDENTPDIREVLSDIKVVNGNIHPESHQTRTPGDTDIVNDQRSLFADAGGIAARPREDISVEIPPVKENQTCDITVHTKSPAIEDATFPSDCGDGVSNETIISTIDNFPSITNSTAYYTPENESLGEDYKNTPRESVSTPNSGRHLSFDASKEFDMILEKTNMESNEDRINTVTNDILGDEVENSSQNNIDEQVSAHVDNDNHILSDEDKDVSSLELHNDDLPPSPPLTLPPPLNTIAQNGMKDFPDPGTQEFVFVQGTSRSRSSSISLTSFGEEEETVDVTVDEQQVVDPSPEQNIESQRLDRTIEWQNGFTECENGVDEEILQKTNEENYSELSAMMVTQLEAQDESQTVKNTEELEAQENEIIMSKTDRDVDIDFSTFQNGSDPSQNKSKQDQDKFFYVNDWAPSVSFGGEAGNNEKDHENNATSAPSSSSNTDTQLANDDNFFHNSVTLLVDKPIEGGDVVQIQSTNVTISESSEDSDPYDANIQIDESQDHDLEDINPNLPLTDIPTMSYLNMSTDSVDTSKWSDDSSYLSSYDAISPLPIEINAENDVATVVVSENSDIAREGERNDVFSSYETGDVDMVFDNNNTVTNLRFVADNDICDAREEKRGGVMEIVVRNDFEKENTHDDNNSVPAWDTTAGSDGEQQSRSRSSSTSCKSSSSDSKTMEGNAIPTLKIHSEFSKGHENLSRLSNSSFSSATTLEKGPP